MSEETQKLGRMMYAIETETKQNPNLDPVFELIRKRGGVVNSGVALIGPQDPNFNSKHPDFVEKVVMLGLGDELEAAVKKAYGL